MHSENQSEQWVRGSFKQKRAWGLLAQISLICLSVSSYGDIVSDVITYTPNIGGYAKATAQGGMGDVAGSRATAYGASGVFTQFTLSSTITSGADEIYVQSLAGWTTPVPDEQAFCGEEYCSSGASWMFALPAEADATKWLYGNPNTQLASSGATGVLGLGILSLNSAADGLSSSVAEVDFRLDPGQLPANTSLSVGFGNLAASFNGSLQVAITRNGVLAYNQSFTSAGVMGALQDGVLPLGNIVAGELGTADYHMTVTLKSYVPGDSFQTRFVLCAPTSSPHIWSNPLGGDFGASANWSSGVSPSGKSVYVHFLDSIGSDQTVGLSNDVTVGQINFKNAKRYTLEGPGTLHLSSASTAGISLITGSHTISAPVSFDSATKLDVGNQTLTLSGPLSWNQDVSVTRGTVVLSNKAKSVTSGTSLTIESSATVIATGNLDCFSDGTTRLAIDNWGSLKVNGGIKNAHSIWGGDVKVEGAGTQLNASSIVFCKSLSIVGGARVALRPNNTIYGTSWIESLSIDETTPGGLDLGNNDLFIHWESTQPKPYDQIREMVLRGEEGGIYSSLPMVGETSYPSAIAIIDNDGLGLTEYKNYRFKKDRLLLLVYTFLGDVNVDHRVDEEDLIPVLANLNHAGTWMQGDANLDGWVDLADYNLVQGNLGAGGVEMIQGAMMVPEPSSIGILSLFSLILLGRPKKT